MVAYNLEDFKGLKIKHKDMLEWTCGNCGEKHYDQYRNIFRRKFICKCYQIEGQIARIETSLYPYGFTFLKDRTDLYPYDPTKMIDLAYTSLPLQCLNCGKITVSRPNNIILGRKKCDCNPNKQNRNQLTITEFIDRWTKNNQANFSLISDKYAGRAKKYIIKCNECGAVDERWGISLEGNDILCKHCQYGSLGEKTIQSFLQEHNIEYIKEFPVLINGKKRRYDFFLPTFNTIIEFNGIQHYEYVPYFHSKRTLKEEQARDIEKIVYCAENGINLIVIKYDDNINEKIMCSLRFNDQA